MSTKHDRVLWETNQTIKNLNQNLLGKEHKDKINELNNEMINLKNEIHALELHREKLGLKGVNLDEYNSLFKKNE